MTTKSSPTIWDRVLQKLPPEDCLHISGTPGCDRDRRELVSEIVKLAEAKNKERKDKQWHFKFRREETCVRDVFCMVIDWVQKVGQIGDVIFQYNAGHLALPWAGFKLVLMVITTDNENLGSILLGLESISSGLGRCEVIEESLRSAKQTKTEDIQFMKRSIEAYYEKAIEYLITAIKFFNRNMASKIIGGVFHTFGIAARLEALIPAESEFTKCTTILNLRFNQDNYISIKRNLDALGKSVSRVESSVHRMEDVGYKVEDTVSRVENSVSRVGNSVSRVENSVSSVEKRVAQQMSDKERRMILKWLSKAKYEREHDFAREGRLVGTGDWLLDNGSFRKWLDSDAHPIFFLHGGIGFGKSKLASLVIDTIQELIKDGAVAYFYCKADGAQQPKSEDIYRAIVRQLAYQPHIVDMIQLPVVQEYSSLKKKGRSGDGLIPESVAKKLLDTLVNLYPKTFIFIDGLDECELKSRVEVLKYFQRFAEVGRCSKDLKIFISSREDRDAIRILKGCLDAVITPSDNQQDIEAFIKHKLKAEYFACEELSPSMIEEIKTVLGKNAHGMFLWVELEINDLARRDFAWNIETWLQNVTLPEPPNGNLHKHRSDNLPAALKCSYDKIMVNIRDQKDEAPDFAIKIFRWLIAAERDLTADELLSSFMIGEVNDEGKLINGRNRLNESVVLKICQPLLKIHQPFRRIHQPAPEVHQPVPEVHQPLVKYGSKRFRFMHQSFKEYLLDQLETSKQESDLFVTSLCALAYGYEPRLCEYYRHNLVRKADYKLAAEKHGLPEVFAYILSYWEHHLQKCFSKADPRYHQIGDVLYMSERFRFYINHLLSCPDEDFTKTKILDGMRYSGHGDLSDLLQYILLFAHDRETVERRISLATGGAFDPDELSHCCAEFITKIVIHGIYSTVTEPSRKGEHLSIVLTTKLLEYYPESVSIVCSEPFCRPRCRACKAQRGNPNGIQKRQTTLLVALCSSALIGNYLCWEYKLVGAEAKRNGFKHPPRLDAVRLRFQLIAQAIALGSDLSMQFTGHGFYQDTPLHIFLQYSPSTEWFPLEEIQQMVITMVSAGADITARGGKGKLPVDRVKNSSKDLALFIKTLSGGETFSEAPGEVTINC